MKRPEPTNLSSKACRLLRPTVLAGTLALGCCGLAWAQAGFQNSGPVIGDDVMYSIGCWRARTTRRHDAAWCVARSLASSPSWRWKPAC